MAYQYKTVPVAPAIGVASKKKQGHQAAAHLQSVLDEHAVDGWEFFRIDTFDVHRPAGCLAIFGEGTEVTAYYVATFRRGISA